MIYHFKIKMGYLFSRYAIPLFILVDLAANWLRQGLYQLGQAEMNSFCANRKAEMNSFVPIGKQKLMSFFMPMPNRKVGINADVILHSCNPGNGLCTKNRKRNWICSLTYSAASSFNHFLSFF